ncbi:MULTISPECIES: phage portal protein [Limosilactobacillus]|uniref:Phage portal protein n=1 Tax=Limosilactobacillus albertensis TaxID=2759752 RepID=A0A839H1J4_9LACO|nr:MULTISPECIES: phage portal protein [Limosilactobacillus]MBB1123554.1 phage portal protein [Limosilactobacillus albertensis]MCC4517835.1 phage portal protein [Limosilactobacillus reuteri]MCD7122675.1 phage portal protein [Limosilactobacillus albertensis]MQB56513.1 phage portal protein [Limosilactobacillus reuteri]MQC02048.1 phage portal protein [Limosilactobacillus reuteri]
MLFHTEKRDWAQDYIDQGILPGFSNMPSYSGIGALRNSDVLTAVSHVASNVARFPIVILDDDKNAVKNIKSVDYLLNKHPNDMLSAYHWRFLMTVNAILTGDGFSRIIRDPHTKAPLEIQYFPPSQTYIDDSDVTNIKYEFTPINQKGGGQTIVVPAEDVIHFMFFTYDGIHGRSPLLSLADEIGLQDDGIKTLRRFFKSGLKGGLLKAKGKLSPEARLKTRQAFEYAQANSNAGSPIVTDDTFDYSPIEIDTNVLQLINSNNYSTAQIAKALHIPAYKLAVNSPNQSIKQLNEDFITSDLPYYFKPIASNLEMTMLTDRQRHNCHIEFDTRKETGMSMDDVQKGVTNNVITPNEGRVRMGLVKSDNPDLDRFQSTLNTVFLDKKEEYQKQSTAKGGGIDDKRLGNSTVNDANSDENGN